VVEVAGDHREGVGVEDGEQLVLAEPEELLQVPGRRAQSRGRLAADGIRRR
jgi:hypothetical protein